MKNKIFILLLFSIVNIVSLSARALYVDGFAAIVGNTSEEDSLLQFAQNHQITTLLLYELHLVHGNTPLNNTSTNGNLAAFIHKAKTNYNITKIGALAENATFFSTVIDAYNNSRTIATEKFDIYNIEFEFWIDAAVHSGGYYCTTYLMPNGFSCDSTGAFAFYLQELSAIKTLATNNSHPISVETYIGWANASEIQQMKLFLDKILIHAYRLTPLDAYNYTRSRLAAAGADSTNFDISVIFSAEPNFMQSWLENNSMLAAENIYTTDFNNENSTWIQYLNLTEFTYFAYSFAKTIILPTQQIENNSKELPIYPNPVQDDLNILLPKTWKGNGNIAIFSTTGQLVKQLNVSINDNHQVRVNCKGLAAGVYQIIVENSRKERIIKQFVYTNF